MTMSGIKRCRSSKDWGFTLARHCYNCATIFWVRPRTMRQGNGKYCSRECMWEFGVSQKATGKWPKGRPATESMKKALHEYSVKSKTEETKRKISEAQKGEKSHNWKGGISTDRVKACNSNEYRSWRKSVYKRDGYVCALCGTIGGKLNAHHILPFFEIEHRYNIDNGITLCLECHWIIETLKNRGIDYCPLPRKTKILARSKTHREFGEPPVEKRGNTEPSRQAAEGVETMHDAPVRDEDIVQTTNVYYGGESHSWQVGYPGMYYLGKL